MSFHAATVSIQEEDSAVLPALDKSLKSLSMQAMRGQQRPRTELLKANPTKQTISERRCKFGCTTN